MKEKERARWIWGEAVLVALQISSLFEPLMPSVHLTCSVGIFKPTKKKYLNSTNATQQPDVISTKPLCTCDAGAWSKTSSQQRNQRSPSPTTYSNRRSSERLPFGFSNLLIGKTCIPTRGPGQHSLQGKLNMKKHVMNPWGSRHLCEVQPNKAAPPVWKPPQAPELVLGWPGHCPKLEHKHSSFARFYQI